MPIGMRINGLLSRGRALDAAQPEAIRGGGAMTGRYTRGYDQELSAQRIATVLRDRIDGGYPSPPCAAFTRTIDQTWQRERTGWDGYAWLALASAKGRIEGLLGGLGGQKLAYDF